MIVVDTSALAKLLVAEEESGALRRLALHVATALAAEATALVTYDLRQADAAERERGAPLFAEGCRRPRRLTCASPLSRRGRT